MRRRDLLAATGSLGGAIGSAMVTPSLAQSKPVFLDYTQEQLDKAYDQSFWAPQMAELEADHGATSAEVRRKMPPRTERYGTNVADLIDIFTPPNARGVPVLVFIHGGAWTRNAAGCVVSGADPCRTGSCLSGARLRQREDDQPSRDDRDLPPCDRMDGPQRRELRWRSHGAPISPVAS